MVSEALLLPVEEFDMQACQGTCGRTLPLGEFPRRPENRLGVAKKCKKCWSEYSREWNKKNPDKYVNSHLQRNYGITLDDYNVILASQHGVCAICGEIPEGPRNQRRGAHLIFKARLVVDHDHATGKVRGLLCSTCNTGIGALKDDPATIRSALAYLERS